VRRLAALVAIVATAAALHLGVRRLAAARAPLPDLGALPAFTLTDQDGRSFDAKNLDAKVTVVDFLFTRCVSICPMLSERMRQLGRHLDGARLDPSQVALVSISVDPQGDTPPALAAYARSHGLEGARFHLLTGGATAVEDVVVRGFHLAMGKPELDAETGRLDVLHAARFVLVDGQRHIRGYYDADVAGTAQLERDIDRLVAGSGR
jgi:protein SCO1/2